MLASESQPVLERWIADAGMPRDRLIRGTAAFQAVAVLEPDAVKLDYFNTG